MHMCTGLDAGQGYDLQALALDHSQRPTGRPR